VHPLFRHNLVEDFSQLTLGLSHHFRAVFLFELEVLFDDSAVVGLLFQSFVELSTEIVEDHSQLFSVPLFTAQLHQNLVNQFLGTFSDFVDDVDF